MVKHTLLLLLVASLATAQDSVYRPGQVLTVAGTVPMTCTLGSVFIKNVAPTGIYICTAVDVWTAIVAENLLPKLDDLTAPDDNTDLNASTAAHGLMQKYPGGTATFLRADGTFTAVGGGAPPTGTGFRHVTSGVEDAAARLIETNDINPNQVTFDKLPIVGLSSLLGRRSSGMGAPEQITLGSNLSMSGTTLNAMGSGVDPWTYLQVNGGVDFTVITTAPVDVPGLAFTPTANTTYEFEALLMIRTATATVNPRIGFAWPTVGMTDGVVMIEESQAVNTVPLTANGNSNAASLIAVGGLPNTTQSWPVRIHGTARSGAAPSGDIRIQLASETGGTTVRIVARSWLRYRSLSF